MQLAAEHNYEDCLSTREVAAHYPIAEATLRYYRHMGVGPRSFKLGRKVVYRKADVEAWIAQQEAATSRGGVIAA
ncbi:MAG: helix-turn-helix transcriptional regulator [Segniliparus sp.]|uniref:helix-turn-helix transcriptional regulator n=1 Tax=Segniliparus sp. TaxID=2804064 RepID=UPI003F3175F7